MKTFPAIAGALALLLAAPPQAGSTTVHAERAQQRTTLRAYIAATRRQTWALQDRAGLERWPSRFLERQGSERYLNYLARMWRHRMKAAHSAYQRASALPAHYRDWLCIHRYEGSWSDPEAPYYGGLQMDLSFQSSYGPAALGYRNAHDLFKAKGTADHWTPLEQMTVAENAYRSGRGFWPWPNTARACGLL